MKKAAFLFVIIALLLIINSLIHSIFDIWGKKDLVVSAQKELYQEELKNKKLKADLSYVQTDQFIEEQARDKLFLSKPGEQQVLISQNLIDSSKSQKPAQNIPNWQKWLNLFF